MIAFSLSMISVQRVQKVNEIGHLFNTRTMCPDVVVLDGCMPDYMTDSSCQGPSCVAVSQV